MSKNHYQGKFESSKGQKIYLVTDSELNLKFQAHKNRLVNEAIGWIASNSEKYKAKGKQAVFALKKVCDIGSKQKMVTVEQNLEALKLFASCFANNMRLTNLKLEGEANNCIFSDHELCHLIHFQAEPEYPPFPIGCLRTVFSQSEIESFLKEYHHCCYVKADKISKEYTKALSDMKAKITTKANHITVFGMIWFLMTRMALLLFVGLGGYVSYSYLHRIPWNMYHDVSQRTSNIFQTIGYLGEHGLGINHNSTLVWFFLVLSLLYFLCTAFCLKFLIMDVWRFMVQTRCTYQKDAIGNLIYRLESAVNFAKASNGIYMPNKVNFLEKIKSVFFSENQKLPKRQPKRNMWWALVCTCILILTSSLSNVPRRLEKFDENVGKIGNFFHEFHVKAQKPGNSAVSLNVYAKPADESFILYTLGSGKEYYFVPEETPVEGYTKIRFKTEYGYLSGWIHNQDVTTFHPEHCREISWISPVKYVATSDTDWEGFSGVQNVGDRYLHTAWREDRAGAGEGEVVELKFNKDDADVIHTKYIKTIGFAIGRCNNEWTYQNSGRPTVFDVRFVRDFKIKETVEVVLEDTHNMQYISFTKPIPAESVEFMIQKVLPGEYDSDAYISEIEIYGVEKPR